MHALTPVPDVKAPQSVPTDNPSDAMVSWVERNSVGLEPLPHEVLVRIARVFSD